MSPDNRGLTVHTIISLIYLLLEEISILIKTYYSGHSKGLVQETTTISVAFKEHKISILSYLTTNAPINKKSGH